MSLVQLNTHKGSVRRPNYEYSPPDFLELHLNENQRVVQIEWRRGIDSLRRKTADWHYVVWVETRL